MNLQCLFISLTFVFVQVTYGLLVSQDNGLILSDDLPPEVLPAWRQLPQFLQLTHSAHQTDIIKQTSC